MPLTLLATLLLVVLPLTARAQTLGRDMQTLLDICVGLRTSLSEGDCDSTKVWGNRLNQFRRQPGYQALQGGLFESLTDCAEQDSLSGHICFHLDYVMEVVQTCVQPKHFKPHTLTRGDGAQVAHKVVPAGGRLDFRLRECAGALQLFVVAEAGEGMGLVLTAGGEAVAVESPSPGVWQAAWTQPDADADVFLSLSNSSLHDTYCCIAFH